MRSSSIQLTTIALGVLLAAGCTAPDDDAGTAAAPDIAEPAPAPAPSGTTPEPAPVDTAPAASVPARFQGDYAADATACTSPGHESELSIEASRIAFHESSGGITAVDTRGNDIEITAQVTGEGETRDVTYSFSLSEDDQTLTDTVNGMARQRCD